MAYCEVTANEIEKELDRALVHAERLRGEVSKPAFDGLLVRGNNE